MIIGVTSFQGKEGIWLISLLRVIFSNMISVRLMLQGLDPEAEYEITEPIPNNITQATGNLMIIESAGEIIIYLCSFRIVTFYDCVIVV